MSHIYETDPVGDPAQPPYLNAVARGDTTLSAEALLAVCQDIEIALGRVRPPGQTKASRTIDIDVLLFGDQVIDLPSLQVPHPALLQRPFVLIPLADVADVGLSHPVTGQALSGATDGSSLPVGVRRLSE